MKQFLVLVAVAMMTVLSANAQNREGDYSIQPRVGATFSTLTNTDDAQMKLNVVYGVEYEQYLTDQFSVAGGVLFTNQGTKFKGDNSTFNNYYCAVPLTANYYVLPGLALKAGLQPAYRMKTNMKVDGQTYDFDKVMEILFEGTDVKMNDFDLSIPVGLSYEYNGVTLDARYNFGVTKLFSGINDSVLNQVITVTLGYKL